MNIYAWCLVILVTSLLAFWIGHRINREPARLARQLQLGNVEQAMANVQLPRAARLATDDPPSGHRHYGNGLMNFTDLHSNRTFQGASQTGQPVPWDLANAAYTLGQQRASQDQITREVDAIMLEIELNPEKWQT